MRILIHCVLIVAFASLVKYVYRHSSNPLPNSPLNYLSSVQQAPPQVKYYTLAVQWPPGVCTGNSSVTCKITPVPAKFTIHGLWPETKRTPSNVTFNVTEIATLIKEMNETWPDLNGNNEGFWQHEWDSHGRKSGLGVFEYFERTLKLNKFAGQGLEEKLSEKLFYKNITPTNTYKLADIEAAVKTINGNFSCTIRCVRSLRSNEQQIQEIRFKYTNSFEKQNNTASTNCAPVLFPDLFPDRE